MIWRILLLGLFGVLSGWANVEGPSEFYIVSEFFSDDGGLFYYRVIDVAPDGPDTLIRFIRVAPLNVVCARRTIVQARETRLRNTSPAGLAGQSNPCSVSQQEFNKTLKRNSQKASILEAISFGIVAKCGSGTTELGLPISESVKIDQLKRSHPEMERLYDLPSAIVHRVFADKDIFNDASDPDAQELQRSGAELVPILNSGKYDQGLAEATKGGVGNWKSPSFRELLKDYSRPISKASALTPQLADAGTYSFTNYVDPVYPALAKSARIQGKVQLQLSIVRGTGEVTGVKLLSGHPMLVQSAVSAAKQWRFAPGSVDSESLDVGLEYSLRCP